MASPRKWHLFTQGYGGREASVLVNLQFSGFKHWPGLNGSPAVHPEESGVSRAKPTFPRTSNSQALCPWNYCSLQWGHWKRSTRGWINKPRGPVWKCQWGAPSLPWAERCGAPPARGEVLTGNQHSYLTYSPLPSPSSLLPVFALPSGGSESGRSTPSLSVLSDSKPPPCTYQQAPRHFHVPGRNPDA